MFLHVPVGIDTHSYGERGKGEKKERGRKDGRNERRKEGNEEDKTYKQKQNKLMIFVLMHLLKD